MRSIKNLILRPGRLSKRRLLLATRIHKSLLANPPNSLNEDDLGQVSWLLALQLIKIGRIKAESRLLIRNCRKNTPALLNQYSEVVKRREEEEILEVLGV